MSQPTLEEVRSWPATVDVSEACAVLGISKSHGYEQIKLGHFPVRVLAVGQRYRVVTADLVALLSAQSAA